MAGNPRDVNLDIVGHDHTGRAARSAANNLDRLKRKTDQNSKAAKKLGDAAKHLKKALSDTAALAATMTGTLALAGAAALQAAPYVAQFALAVGQVAATCAPALAALLPLAAGFQLVKRTIVLAGPQMGKALQPVAKAWTDQEKVVGRLASQGLRSLAQSFVKVNFPSIEKAQGRIAKALNDSAQFAIRWANTAPGQKVIRTITAETATAFERLAPSVTAVAISAGLLAGRIAKVSFRAFGKGADYALTKLNALMDSITEKDVEGAFRRIKELGRQAGAGIRKIGDGLEWVKTHEETITIIKTALAGLAVVIGVVLVNPMLILAGAVSLLITHWDKVKAAAQRVKDTFNEVKDKVVDLYNRTPQLQEAVRVLRVGFDLLRRGVKRFIDGAAPGFKSFLQDIQPLLIELAPIFAKLLAALLVMEAAWLAMVGVLVGATLWWVGKVAKAIAWLLRAFTSFAKSVYVVFLGIQVKAANMVASILEFFGRIPGPIGDVFRRAAQSARDAAQKIQGHVNEINIQRAKDKITDMKNRLVELGKMKPTPKVKAEIAELKRKIAAARRYLDGINGKTVKTYVITTVRTRVPGRTGPDEAVRTSAGGVGFARTAPGGNYRTGGAATIEAPSVTTYVQLDGREIAAHVRSIISEATGRQSFRARSGRR